MNPWLTTGAHTAPAVMTATARPEAPTLLRHACPRRGRKPGFPHVDTARARHVSIAQPRPDPEGRGGTPPVPPPDRAADTRPVHTPAGSTHAKMPVGACPPRPVDPPDSLAGRIPSSGIRGDRHPDHHPDQHPHRPYTVGVDEREGAGQGAVTPAVDSPDSSTGFNALPTARQVTPWAEAMTRLVVGCAGHRGADPR